MTDEEFKKYIIEERKKQGKPCGGYFLMGLEGRITKFKKKMQKKDGK